MGYNPTNSKLNKSMKYIKAIFVLSCFIGIKVDAQNEKLILNYSGGTAPAEISLASGSTVQILSATGDVLITTDKTALELAAILGIDGSANPPSVNITSSSTVLISDVDSATLTWTISDATSCVKMGAWSGSLPPSNGSMNIGPFTGPLSSNYTIECTNGFDVVSNTVTVNVTDPNGLNCSIEQPPILSGAEDRTIVANQSSNPIAYDGTWKDIRNMTGDPDWPGTTNNILLSLTKDQYISAKFNSGSATLSGQIQLTNPTANEGPNSNAQSYSFSECPGDFSIHLQQAKCVASGGFIRWSTDPAANPLVYCILEKNKDYYLNYVHSDNTESDNYNTSDCPSAYCGAILTQSLF